MTTMLAAVWIPSFWISLSTDKVEITSIEKVLGVLSLGLNSKNIYGSRLSVVATE